MDEPAATLASQGVSHLSTTSDAGLLNFRVRISPSFSIEKYETGCFQAAMAAGSVSLAPFTITRDIKNVILVRFLFRCNPPPGNSQQET